MKIVAAFAVMFVAAVFLGASGEPANAIKLNVYIGPNINPHAYGPRKRCRYETRQTYCERERVCTWRSRRTGRCKRLEWKRVCHRERVQVCY